ncbi:MAG: Response regulator protein GraR [Firmicutes bacterium ADurb.Bin506]|nr:MAG: Response regulator protein GraR [Firmicutes bacterium ADurb.Bin506]
MYRIMIVEDDDKITDILRGYLVRYGYDPVTPSSLRDIKSEFIAANPHLVLLDVNLPYMDGFFWCRQIRTVSNAPVIFISARSGDMDQVLALDNGGDDYITKPFSVDVVIAKIRAALRRAYGEYAAQAGSDPDVLEVRGLYLHRGRSAVEWRGAEVFLTPKEFRLLDVLARRAGQVVPRTSLLEALWDDVEFVDDNTLTVNVTRLRHKLSSIGIVDAVDTVRGEGYRLLPSWDARDNPAPAASSEESG